MLVYYIIFFYILIIAVISNNFTLKTKKILLEINVILLIILAGMRGFGVDADYKAYYLLFRKIPAIDNMFFHTLSFLKVANYEPSYIFINSIAKTLFGEYSFQIVIMTYAIISISMKKLAIIKLTDFWEYSLLIYFSTYFLLQDMTQIRIGVATGFILLSIPYIINRNLKFFLIFMAFAVLFHYAAIVFVPMYLLNVKKINKTLYISIIILSIALALTKYTPFDIILKYDFGVFTDKIRNYLLGQAWDKRTINIFNFATIIQLIITFIFIFYSSKIENKNAILLTKLSAIGIFAFFIFSASPVIAFRVSDIFNTVLMILIPYFFYIVKPKVIVEILIIMISFAYILNQILIHAIMQRYCLFFCQ